MVRKSIIADPSVHIIGNIMNGLGPGPLPVYWMCQPRVSGTKNVKSHVDAVISPNSHDASTFICFLVY